LARSGKRSRFSLPADVAKEFAARLGRPPPKTREKKTEPRNTGAPPARRAPGFRLSATSTSRWNVVHETGIDRRFIVSNTILSIKEVGRGFRRGGKEGRKTWAVQSGPHGVRHVRREERIKKVDGAQRAGGMCHCSSTWTALIQSCSISKTQDMATVSVLLHEKNTSAAQAYGIIERPRRSCPPLLASTPFLLGQAMAPELKLKENASKRVTSFSASGLYGGNRRLVPRILLPHDSRPRK